MKNFFYLVLLFISTLYAQQDSIPSSKQSKVDFVTIARCVQRKKLPITASPIAQAVDAEEEAEVTEEETTDSSVESEQETVPFDTNSDTQ